jgi:hypothetical protein
LQNETFATDAATARAIYPGGSGVAAGRTTLTIAYDAAAGTYTVTDPAGSRRFAAQDRDPAADSDRSSLYTRTAGTITDRLLLTKPGDSGLLNYRYVGAGLWRRTETDAGIESNRIDAFTYGIRTADAQLPRTGSASYAVGLTGLQDTALGVSEFNGSGLVTFDFAARTLNGQGLTLVRTPGSDGFFNLAWGSFTVGGSSEAAAMSSPAP